MIETEQAVVVNAAIGDVWSYARDVERWAEIMPGYQQCALIDEDNSRWVLKVGVGGLVRTVKVVVRVERWAGPEEVDFTYRLEGDPVEGGGSYRAVAKGAAATEITLKVRVNGSGQMAPMWEAMAGPLLPKFALGFAEQLKARIEEALGVAAPVAVRLSLWARLRAWLGRALGGARETTPTTDPKLEENRAVALKFIESMSTNDARLADECLAPDARAVTKGYGKFAGIRQRETMVGMIEAFNQMVPGGLRLTVRTVTAEGDRVVVECEGDATTSTGERYANQYCFVFTLRDGKIVQADEYLCNVLADAVLWPLVEGQAGMQSSPHQGG